MPFFLMCVRLLTRVCSGDRPSQQGQTTRPSLTPLEELIPRAAKSQKKLAILLRGPPGSGKSWVAKKIKEKEPDTRILSIDDYFEVEREIDEVDAKGRHTTRKVKHDPFSQSVSHWPIKINRVTELLNANWNLFELSFKFGIFELNWTELRQVWIWSKFNNGTRDGSRI